MEDILSGIRDDFKTMFWPKRYFAWQTLLLLSLFSLVVATAIDSIEGTHQLSVDVLTTLSWIFFTFAVWWALAETKPLTVAKFSLSPWITGIVLCLFLFRPWTETRFRWALSSWPLISTGIKALPHFVNWELKFGLPKIAVQKTLVMTTLVNLLLSSWIMFHFRIQDWVKNYPSLLVNQMEESAFVYDFGPERNRPSQGGVLLNSLSGAIAQELNNQPWYQTERWLYTRKSRLETISRRALDDMEASDESLFWQIEIPEPRPFGEGYLLDLKATWSGPVARQTGFFLEKTCKIVPEERVRPSRGASGSTSTGQSQTSSETTTGAEEETPLPTSQITSVTCGEETPIEQWTTARAQS